MITELLCDTSQSGFLLGNNVQLSGLVLKCRKREESSRVLIFEKSYKISCMSGVTTRIKQSVVLGGGRNMLKSVNLTDTKHPLSAILQEY